jgi:xylan 1,4-beta-xylosidase
MSETSRDGAATTIRNPVLPGFHPDPSIVRAEGRYVVATSTFEWFPGVRLHTSDDLVHWSLVGHALTDPDHLPLRGIPDSGGVWAPSVSYERGLYRIVYSVVRTMAGQTKDLDSFVTTAPTPEGPWDKPTYVGSRGFDPSLFTDDDGRLYLASLRWDHRSGHAKFGGIVVQELDPVTFDRLGQAQVVHTSAELVEGPNLYRRDGWYYLLLAEGGTGWNHGVRLARSRSLWGPYDEDPVPLLTTRDLDPSATALAGADGPSQGWHKAGHGELVETDDGGWYLVHLASRPVMTAEGPACVLGRETCVQAVRWTQDGWLRLAHGSTLPVTAVPAPVRAGEVWAGSEGERRSQPEDGRLSPDSLGRRWVTLRAPADTTWASWTDDSPSRLRLRGRDSLRSVVDQSLVAHRVTAPCVRLDAVVHADPREPAHRAGVTAYYDTTGHLFWYLSTDDHGRRVLGRERRDAHHESDVELDVDVSGWTSVHMRLIVDRDLLQLAVSPDGAQWQHVDEPHDTAALSDDHAGLLRFTGAFLGIAVSDLAERSWTADFADVTITTEAAALARPEEPS